MKRYQKILVLTVAAVMLLGAVPALAGAAPVDSQYVTLAKLREQAAEGWHETYQSHGREVTTNVDINNMPEADICPILQVEAIQVNPEAWEAVQSIPGIDASMPRDIGVSALMLEDPLYVCGQYYGETDSDQDLQFENGEEPTVDAEACDLTYQEFRARVNGTLSELVGLTLEDFRLDNISVSGLAYKAKKRDGVLVRGEQLTATGYYGMTGTQLLNGVPVLRCFVKSTPGGVFIYDYRSEGWYMYAVACSRIVAEEEDDVPLLSFDAMKQGIEAQIEAGEMRGVDEMEFGYQICCRDTADGRQWLTIPMWRVLGGYSTDLNKEHVMPYYDERDTDGSITAPENYRNYYYNAQTGEMIDTSAFWKDDKPLPAGEILTWDSMRK